MQVENGFNEICRTQVRKHYQTLLAGGLCIMQVDYALNRCKIRVRALQGQKQPRRKKCEDTVTLHTYCFYLTQVECVLLDGASALCNKHRTHGYKTNLHFYLFIL